MQGHIRRRGKDSWTVVVNLGRDPVTGKRRQLWRSVRGTKRDAEATLLHVLHERNLGIDAPPAKLTVAEYLTRWLNDYVRTNVSPSTVLPYSTCVHRHLTPALGAIPLTKLRPQHIQQYYSQALRDGRSDGRGGGLSPTTVLYHHRVLREALQHAVRWQLLARNPADAVDPPRAERREIGTLNAEEVRRLLLAAEETPHGALVHLAAMTGMRRGELLGLRWRDVDLDGATLHVRQTLKRLPGNRLGYGPPKTHRSSRPVALSPETVRSLRAHRSRQAEDRLKLGPAYQDDDLVFATAVGTPIDPSNLHRAWKQIVGRAGLAGVRFHDLRHAHATIMLTEGVHPKIVSERLGHATIGITLDTYSHVLPGLQAEAAAVLDRVFGSGRCETG
jgi:integrase